jgi:hypothetical protein
MMNHFIIYQLEHLVKLNKQKNKLLVKMANGFIVK